MAPKPKDIPKIQEIDLTEIVNYKNPSFHSIERDQVAKKERQWRILASSSLSCRVRANLIYLRRRKGTAKDREKGTEGNLKE